MIFNYFRLLVLIIVIINSDVKIHERYQDIVAINQ